MRRNLPSFVYPEGSKYCVIFRNEKNELQKYSDFTTVENASTFANKKKTESRLAKRQLETEKPISRKFASSVEVAYITVNKHKTLNQQIQVLVDDEVWHQVEKWSWSWNGHPRRHAMGNPNSRSLQLHRFIYSLLHPDESLDKQGIVHKNGDIWDCRGNNLVRETYQQRRAKGRATQNCQAKEVVLTRKVTTQGLQAENEANNFDTNAVPGKEIQGEIDQDAVDETNNAQKKMDMKDTIERRPILRTLPAFVHKRSNNTFYVRIPNAHGVKHCCSGFATVEAAQAFAKSKWEEFHPNKVWVEKPRYGLPSKNVAQEPKIPSLANRMQDATIFHDNETVSLPIFRGEDIIAYTLISAIKYDLVRDMRLFLSPNKKSPYVIAKRGTQPSVTLSHLLTGTPPQGYVKDHIDRDTLNNTDNNLRNATRTQNSQNKKKARQFFGISKSRKRFVAQLQHEGKKHTWSFKSAIAAATQYDKAAYYYFGEHAQTNGLLTSQEKTDALTTPPPHTGRRKPKYILRKAGMYNLRLRDATGELCRFSGFPTFSAAKEFLDQKQIEFQNEREKLVAAQEITKDNANAAFIALNQRSKPSDEQERALVDETLWRQIAQYSWSRCGNDYPAGSVNGWKIRLHRFVWRLLHPDAKIPVDMVIDHINGNRLDARAANLQMLTHSDNIAKVPRPLPEKTQLREVSERGHPKRRHFRAKMNYGGRQVDIGLFPTSHEAGQAVDLARRLLRPNLYAEKVPP